MKRSLLGVCLLVSLCGMASAQQSTAQPVPTAQVVVPRLIRFSGQLPGATGTVGITFTLHKGQQDNAALWIETQNVQLDSTGKYTVLLGVTKPEGIPTDLFSSGEAQWLGVQVQGRTEQPRVLLVSVPYALRAAEADTLAGHSPAEFVTTDKLSSAVQQELQSSSSTNSTAVHKNTVNKNSVPVDGATNFTDTTTNQVVLVTQNGTGAGLIANAGNNYALSGTSTNTAIYGSSNGATHATAAALEGVTTASQGRGIFGWANTTTGVNFGLYGQANSVSGTGIAAVSTATTGTTVGMEVQDNSPSGTAAVIQARGGGKIISGQSGSSNTQVFDVDGSGNITTNGYVGVGLAGVSDFPIESTTSTNEYNMVAYDYATNGYAVWGYGLYTGVYGESPYVGLWGSAAEYGVYGEATGTGEYGVEGWDMAGYGLWSGNETTSYPAAEFENEAGAGIAGVAVLGISASGRASTVKSGLGYYDAAGEFEGPNGVIGSASSDSSIGDGVIGINTGAGGIGVHGYNSGSTGMAVYGEDESGSSSAYAGFFAGNVEITGTLDGTALAVKVDDPTDPANKFLSHASVESPELKTFYDGTVVLDGSGQAEVTLPSYFQALNKDFRYQLTCIGGYAPVYIAREVENNSFRIAGGAPGMKISWTVTGVRHDAYATAHPLVVETQKSAEEQGRYLSPRELGVAAELKVGARTQHGTSQLVPSQHTRPKPSAPPKQQSLEKIAAK